MFQIDLDQGHPEIPAVSQRFTAQGDDLAVFDLTFPGVEVRLADGFWRNSPSRLELPMIGSQSRMNGRSENLSVSSLPLRGNFTTLSK